MAPSERELSPQATEGETNNLTAPKSQALSPTRFAGAPSQRGPFTQSYRKPAPNATHKNTAAPGLGVPGAAAIKSLFPLKTVYKLLNRVQSLVQIGEDVVDMLGADGQADGVLVDAHILQLLGGQLGVGGGGRVDD